MAYSLNVDQSYSVPALWPVRGAAAAAWVLGPLGCAVVAFRSLRKDANDSISRSILIWGYLRTGTLPCLRGRADIHVPRGLAQPRVAVGTRSGGNRPTTPRQPPAQARPNGARRNSELLGLGAIVLVVIATVPMAATAAKALLSASLDRPSLSGTLLQNLRARRTAPWAMIFFGCALMALC